MQNNQCLNSAAAKGLRKLVTSFIVNFLFYYLWKLKEYLKTSMQDPSRMYTTTKTAFAKNLILKQ